jgi:urease accessory protein
MQEFFVARRWAAWMVLVVVVVLLPDVAGAHEDQVIRLGSFWGGFLHPVLGLDHFLAMVAVGVVSAQLGGRAIWTVPSTFVGAMAVGFLLGRIGLGIEVAAEWGIITSVVLLGGVIASGGRISFGWVAGAVALFAIFHGYAHGVETPAVANPTVYAIGFLVGTALIHLLGVLIGVISKRYSRGPAVLRLGGVAVASVGLLFAAGVL